MIHSKSTPSTPAQKSKTLRGFPSMNFTRFHRKVTPAFFSGSSSEASSSQTSLHALDTSSSTTCHTTSSSLPSPVESTNDATRTSLADLVGRPIMDPKLLNELMEGKGSATLLAKPVPPHLGRSKSAEPLAKPAASQDFSPLVSRRPYAREDRFYRPDEHSDSDDQPTTLVPSQSGPLKADMRFPF